MSDFMRRGPSLVFKTALAAVLIFSVADEADAKSRHKKKRYKPVPERMATIAIDAETNEVLDSKYADEVRHPASLTKVMTLFMLFDAIESGDMSLNDRIIVSANAAGKPPTKLGVPAGSSVSVEEAINALVIQSANDVATAVAEKLGGTETRFASMMTSRAKELGLEKTVFVNASGLPDKRQVTTARDMATLSQALMTNHPGMYKYFSATEMTYGPARYRNHNRLLGQIDGVDGIKTGYTRMSGFNLTTSAVKDGRRVIAVVLGGQTSRSRDARMKSLLETSFADLGSRSPNRMASAAGQPRIAFGSLPLSVQPRPSVTMPSTRTGLMFAPNSSGSSNSASGLSLDGLRGRLDIVPDLY